MMFFLTQKIKILCAVWIISFFVFFHPSVLYSAPPLQLGDSAIFLQQAVQPTGIRSQNINSYVGNIIKYGLTLIGFLFLVLMVYGGFMWMTARGNDDQIGKARNIIIAAVIGLAVIVSAYAITNFIVGRTVSAGQAENGLTVTSTNP